MACPRFMPLFSNHRLVAKLIAGCDSLFINFDYKICQAILGIDTMNQGDFVLV
jgi:hypothetical protein